ncbi:MAG: hypothetical protein Q4G30_06540 [Actinomycetaceae bacterium]|nr:hypothetical protein [Actinomycetaceae bacterium]
MIKAKKGALSAATALFLMAWMLLIQGNVAHSTPGAVLPAEPPQEISGQVWDPNNYLGDSVNDVNTAISSLKEKGVTLYVAVVADFGAMSPQEWARQTLSLSKAPQESYIYALAMDTRQYDAQPGPDAALSGERIITLAQQVTIDASAPKLGGVIQNFVAALDQELITQGLTTPSEESSASFAIPTGVIIGIIVFAALIAILVGYALYARARRPAGPKLRTEPTLVTPQVDSTPQPTQAALAALEASRALPNETKDKDIAEDGADVDASEQVGAVEEPQYVEDAKEPDESTEDSGPEVADVADVATTGTSAQMVEDLDTPIEIAHAQGLLASARDTLYAAEEDLAVSRQQFGQAATRTFAGDLAQAKVGLRRAIQELSNNPQASAELIQDMQAEGPRAENRVKTHVDSFARLRHRQAGVEASLTDLSNKGQVIAKQVQTSLDQANDSDSSLTKLAVRNLELSKGLLMSANKALQMGQEKIAEGDRVMAVRYARGAERATAQAQLAVGVAAQVKSLNTEAAPENLSQEIAVLERRALVVDSTVAINRKNVPTQLKIRVSNLLERCEEIADIAGRDAGLAAPMVAEANAEVESLAQALNAL